MGRLSYRGLRQAAQELNETMQLEPPIQLDEDPDTLQTDIMETADQIKPFDNDRFSDAAKRIFILVRPELSKFLTVTDIQKASPPAAAKKKVPGRPRKKPKKKPGPKRTLKNYNRAKAFVDAVLNIPPEGISETELGLELNREYVRHGGNNNPDMGYLVRMLLVPLLYFEIVIWKGRLLFLNEEKCK